MTDIKRRRLLYTAQRKTKQWGWSIIRTIFILGFSFVILYPLLTMIARTFMDPKDLYDSSVLWIPKNFTLINIEIAAKGMSYGSAFLNSLWTSVLATLLQLFSCLTAGYAFARYNFPGRNILFVFVLATLIIPPQLTMLSSYMYWSNLGLVGSQWPMMLMSATGMGIRAGLFIYLFRQYFKGMPKETEEAAMVDGAGHIRTFLSVMLPGAVTIIVTVTLFSFVWQWNDVFYVALYDNKFMNLSNGIGSASFAQYFMQYPEYAGFSQYDPIITSNFTSIAALLCVAPLVLLFVVLQRYFVESVERSGVVG
ncbi:MAG: carbohydrate ABC transporter permease [Ruminococcaceae bacterium]|nr:carbohydrate ABC transporter permease [Oscillospiraceae bacterium]